MDQCVWKDKRVETPGDKNTHKKFPLSETFVSVICLSWIFTVLFVFPRSSDQRLASVDRLAKRLSLLTDTDDIVLNFVATDHGSETQSHSVHKEAEGKRLGYSSVAEQAPHVQRLSPWANCQIWIKPLFARSIYVLFSNLSQNPKRTNQKILQNRGVLLRNRWFFISL